jgi:hypothetical protein
MRRILMIAALVSALGAIKMAANPQVRRPVKHFIHFYTQQDDDMDWMARVVYSCLLTERAN